MIHNLLFATLMVCVTAVVHMAGLLSLLWVLRHGGSWRPTADQVFGQVLLILLVFLGIVAIHGVEIWLYAAAFLAVGALTHLETALYFSTVTFSSLGYGDILLSEEWRLFGAIEAANGLILLAWSTAFLLSVTARLRLLEHDWLEQPK
jgi:hypothetical protein